MTLRLVGKSYKTGIGKLLSHEIGHLFGSDHDGVKPTGVDSYYYGQSIKENIKLDIFFLFFSENVPCATGMHLMSPSVQNKMNSWSECTKTMVDDAYKIREQNQQNCFYA